MPEGARVAGAEHPKSDSRRRIESSADKAGVRYLIFSRKCNWWVRWELFGAAAGFYESRILPSFQRFERRIRSNR
jgi:hypothetical protein